MTQMFFAFTAMGLADQMHLKVYQSIHVQHVALQSDGEILDWAVKQGVDRQKFNSIYQSSSVKAQVTQAAQTARTYGINQWPSFAVDGKFVTAFAMTSGGTDELKVALLVANMLSLVGTARAARKK